MTDMNAMSKGEWCTTPPLYKGKPLSYRKTPSDNDLKEVNGVENSTVLSNCDLSDGKVAEIRSRSAPHITTTTF